MKRINPILSRLCAIILLSTHFTLRAQTPAPPQIDTPLTVAQYYFYNAPLTVPYSNGEVGIFNNAEVEIHSTSEVTLLPGFIASVDSGCGEFVAGIRDCPEMELQPLVNPVSCHTSIDGSIKLNVIGGNEPYTYSWSPKSGSSHLMQFLSPGVYSVEVRDMSNCTITAQFEIIQPPPINIQATIYSSICQQSTGSIITDVNGGHGDFSYYWLESGQTSSSIEGLSAGEYKLIVSDSLRCTETKKFNISDSDGPTATFEITSPVKCYGGDDAAVSIHANSPQAFVNWPCETNPDNLTAGDYSVWIEDTLGCKSVLHVVIPEPDPISLNVITTNSACGTYNGAAEVEATGGQGEYQYLWSTGDTTIILQNIKAGKYSIRVLDENECQAEHVVFIEDTNNLDISVGITPPSCITSENGQIDLSLPSNNSATLFEWFPNVSTSNIGSSLTGGEYNVQVTDSNGCINTKKITLLTPTELHIVIETTTLSNNLGSISALVNGGQSPYNYQWSSGGTHSILENVSDGEYEIVVTDNNGCSLSHMAILDVNYASSLATCTDNTPSNFSSFAQSCSTCVTPFGNVLNIQSNFGAIPNDGLSDEASFEWAVDYITNNFCSSNTPVTLFIPAGEYIIGAQVSGFGRFKKGHHVFCFDNCSNVTIEGELNPDGTPATKLIFEDCLYYGAFDPITGQRLLYCKVNPCPGLGNVNEYHKSATIGNVFNLNNCNNFKIRNFELDGKIDRMTIGGYFAADKVGMNLEHDAFYMNNCRNITIEKVDAHHFGRDGIHINEIAPVSEALMNIKIKNSSFNWNCRDGFSWVGGGGVFVDGCEFNYNGFGPFGGTKPGVGADIEYERANATDICHGYFSNCKFWYNRNWGLISDAGRDNTSSLRVHDFYFDKCSFVSASGGYSLVANSRNMNFTCCTVIGPTNSAYDAYLNRVGNSAHDNTKFIKTKFDDEFSDPLTGITYAHTLSASNCSTLTQIEPNPYLIEYYRRSRVLFDNCHITTHRYNRWAYLFGRSIHVNNQIVIRNTRFLNSGLFYSEDPSILPYGENRRLAHFEQVEFQNRNTTFVWDLAGGPIDCHINYWHHCWWAIACPSQVSGRPFPLNVAPSSCPSFPTPMQRSPTGSVHWPYVCAKYPNPPSICPHIDIYNLNCTSPVCDMVLLPVICPNCSLPPSPSNRIRVNKPMPDDNFEIYPNPSSHKLIVTGITPYSNIVVRNILGQVVKRIAALHETVTINIDDLSVGMYFLSSSLDGELKFLKSD